MQRQYVWSIEERNPRSGLNYPAGTVAIERRVAPPHRSAIVNARRFHEAIGTELLRSQQSPLKLQ